MKRLALVFCMLLGSGALGVFLFTTPGCACEDIFPERIYSLNALNPMRDQTPELIAERFLHDQGQGKCVLPEADVCTYALHSHRVSDWRLAARQDDRNSAILYYRVKSRESYQGVTDEFWGQAAVTCTIPIWPVDCDRV
jgi:hypothetical protein